MVLLYDAWLKRTPVGPVAMAACRFLNVILGLTVIPEAALTDGMRAQVAGVVGVYIIGVTWFARTEATTSQRRQLLAAAVVIGLALALALTVRGSFARVPGPGRLPVPVPACWSSGSWSAARWLVRSANRAPVRSRWR